MLLNPIISPKSTSVAATGGVYKRQGRNQRNMMNCTY